MRCGPVRSDAARSSARAQTAVACARARTAAAGTDSSGYRPRADAMPRAAGRGPMRRGPMRRGPMRCGPVRTCDPMRRGPARALGRLEQNVWSRSPPNPHDTCTRAAPPPPPAPPPGGGVRGRLPTPPGASPASSPASSPSSSESSPATHHASIVSGGERAGRRPALHKRGQHSASGQGARAGPPLCKRARGNRGSPGITSISAFNNSKSGASGTAGLEATSSMLSRRC
jgi:hypothetical protein